MNKKYMEMVKKCEDMMAQVGFILPNNIEYKVNNRLKSTWGRCTKLGDNKFIIEVAGFLLEGSVGMNDYWKLENTILHEMCHTLPNGHNHGEVWKRYAEKLNNKYDLKIQRTTSITDSFAQYRFKGKELVRIGCVNGCFSEIVPKKSRVVESIDYVHCVHCKDKVEIVEK